MHRFDHRGPLLAVALALILAVLLGGCDRVEVRKALPVVQERAEKLVSGETPLIALPEDRPAPSKAGQALIIEFEVGGGPAYYNRFLRRPSNGGGVASGVTIGIGYDLRFNSPANIRKDWEPYLDKKTIERLVAVSGKKQTPALLASVRDIEIPWEAALAVYEKTTIPRFWSLTKSTWPGVEDLTPDGQWPVLSLIFNRGSDLSGSRRRQMAAIKDLVPREDYRGLARETRSMKRLWPSVPGLLRRREAEAALWDSCWQGKPLSSLIKYPQKSEKRWSIYPVITASANESAAGWRGYDLTFELRGSVVF